MRVLGRGGGGVGRLRDNIDISLRGLFEEKQNVFGKIVFENVITVIHFIPLADRFDIHQNPFLK